MTGVSVPPERPPVGGAGGAAAPADLPRHGALEELDGTPIVTAARLPRRTSASWALGAAAATAATAGRPGLWAYALVAFLARGGVAVLAFPIVVLPTFVGLANLVGPASVSAAGPGPRLVAIIVAGVAAAAVLMIAGTIVAAAAETALHRATVQDDPSGRAGVLAAAGTAAEVLTVPGPVAGLRRGTTRIALIRLVLLVPLAAAAAIAIPTWVAVAYRELTLPSSVAVPLPIRVLQGAPAVSVLVVVAWLAGEVVGGFAARRAVLLDGPVPRALAGGLVDPLRFPLGTILTVTAALAVSLVVLVPATWAVAAAWDAARRALVDDAGAAASLATSVLLAAAWLAALVVAAIAAAWRATLMTAELLRRLPRPAPGPGVAEPDRRVSCPAAEEAAHPAIVGRQPAGYPSRGARPVRPLIAARQSRSGALLHCAACATGDDPGRHHGSPRTEVGDPAA